MTGALVPLCYPSTTLTSNIPAPPTQCRTSYSPSFTDKMHQATSRWTLSGCRCFIGNIALIRISGTERETHLSDWRQGGNTHRSCDRCQHTSWSNYGVHSRGVKSIMGGFGGGDSSPISIFCGRIRCPICKIWVYTNLARKVYKVPELQNPHGIVFVHYMLSSLIHQV